MTGREKEALKIINANKSASVGRLMLGKISDWKDFIVPSLEEFVALDRKKLKSGANDVRTRMDNELKEFCRNNFERMTQKKLVLLYDSIVPNSGLQLPVRDFESKFSKFVKSVERNYPPHATISISLWGLGFEFPEDHLSKDLIVHINRVRMCDDELKKLQQNTHKENRRIQKDIASYQQELKAASRAIVIIAHSLVEAYYNGLGWDYAMRNKESMESLSNKNRRILLGDCTFRDKLEKMPRLLTGRTPSSNYFEVTDALLGVFKPYRDSLAHPSPFSAPEKFGGYEKLKKIYEFSPFIAESAMMVLCDLLSAIFTHVHESNSFPKWMVELENCRHWVIESDIENSESTIEN